eukprot:NODE_4445_length_1062_cov_124.282215_g4244_i0.p1 GENE.NODE_4445_length_1062_cov_124.282215_g4244_i0~~NODE_4445_length_1062_cov_124.282215_g4244_i0.p1  ORF type:complete len:252 (+),score=22.31 NODE_4445_length_1062_cov_124.282215_g4244_i0:114-869(+)
MITRTTVAALGAFKIVLLILAIYVFHGPLLSFAEWLADYIRAKGPLGPLIMAMLVFSTCFPPLPGYGILLKMCGFIYGPIGFVPAYLGALAGSSSCFLLGRHVMRRHVRELAMKNQTLSAITQVVSEGGFLFVLLVRVAPFPFAICNLLLAGTEISHPTMFKATALGLFKICIHIAIGTSLSTLAHLSDQDHPVERRLFFLPACGIAISIGLLLWLQWRIRAVINQVLAKRHAHVDDANEVIEVVTSCSSL